MSAQPPRSRGPGTEISALLRGTLVLGLLVLVVAGLVRTCSFAPGSPEVDRSALPQVDVAARLPAAAASVPFPVRVPVLPPDWLAQSQDVTVVGERSDPGAPRAVRVGWITPRDAFARLVQTGADEAGAVVSERGDPTPRGAVDAGGRTWTVHTGVRGEQLWVTDLGPVGGGDVRLLVTGSANPAELTTLASASVAAPALPG